MTRKRGRAHAAPRRSRLMTATTAGSAAAHAYVALGSNLGDPVRNVRAAIERLAALSAEPLRVSSLWLTTPVDCPAGSPPFVNAVAALTPRPGETPESLLAQLQALEREFGRARSGLRNEPRPLDLDLIAFGRETRASPELTLPHPRAHQRRFVLQPLCEIAPDLVLPGQTRPVAALLAGLQTQEDLRRLE
jgi:2-amino-4-hydroxy-6-hydroxymethyldihydropteridine diphosphokinase